MVTAMSADILNLRRYRKHKARAAKDAKAAENRARFGRTGGEKTRQARDQERDERLWSGHRIERQDHDPDP
jgi:hypothetical protein